MLPAAMLGGCGGGAPAEDDEGHQVGRVVPVVERAQLLAHVDAAGLRQQPERALVAPSEAVVRVLGLGERGEEAGETRGVGGARLLELALDGAHLPYVRQEEGEEVLFLVVVPQLLYFSLHTSRSAVSNLKSGEAKKWTKRSSASLRCSGCTSK